MQRKAFILSLAIGTASAASNTSLATPHDERGSANADDGHRGDDCPKRPCACDRCSELRPSDGETTRHDWAQATVTTLAGNGNAGWSDGTGGARGAAEFYFPWGIAIDGSGTVFVGDFGNERVRKIDALGNVTTLAGNGAQGFVDGTGGANGSAELWDPSGMAFDVKGVLYVGDVGNERIREIDAQGNVTTLAGNGIRGFADGTGGPAGTAEFSVPSSVAVDAQGNVYVADSGNQRIRKIDPWGNVTTLAGNGTPGFADGTGGPSGTAEFEFPTGIAVDFAGVVYVADWGKHRIRRIDPAGNVTTLAGNGVGGFADGTGGPAGTAEFNRPSGLAFDGNGNVYVADTDNNSIRRIDLCGNVTTVAGNGVAGYADGSGGMTGTAEFDAPTSVALSASGAIYVADHSNNRIRKISLWTGPSVDDHR